jgi:hypothetical protein
VSDISLAASKSQIGYLLFILAFVAVSLFLVFSYVASAEVGEVGGVVLFFVAAGLLIVGYMVGLLFLAVLGVYLLLSRMGWVKGRGAAAGHV